MESSTNRTPTLYLLIAVLWTLSWLTIGIRFFSRYLGCMRLSWDDWLILAAGILVIPAASIELWQGSLGVGKHVPDIKNPNITLITKTIFIDELLYVPLICCIKCSIINFYIRLFGIRPFFTRICYALIAATIAWSIMAIFLTIFQCTPISSRWTGPPEEEKSCIATSAYVLATQLSNVMLDFGILVAPWYPIWQLKLSLVKRFIIAAILLLGASGIAFSIVRLVSTLPFNLEDITWEFATSIIWSIVEICLGVICACLPVMAPLLPRCWRVRSNAETITDPTRLIRSGVSRTAIESKRRFDRLTDDNIEFLENEGSMGIKMTTEITIHRDFDTMALRRLDEGLGFAL